MIPDFRAQELEWARFNRRFARWGPYCPLLVDLLLVFAIVSVQRRAPAALPMMVMPMLVNIGSSIVIFKLRPRMVTNAERIEARYQDG